MMNAIRPHPQIGPLGSDFSPPRSSNFISASPRARLRSLFPSESFKFSANSASFLPSPLLRCYSQHQSDQQIDDEDLMGDSVVFEEDAFEDPIEPYPKNNSNAVSPQKNPTRIPTPEPQNLVPEEWQETVKALHVTQEERHKLQHEIKTDIRLNKKKRELIPLSNISVDDYMKIRKKVLSNFKTVVLENPKFQEMKDHAPGKPPPIMSSSTSSERVAPRDPRREVYGTFDDISKFFNSPAYSTSRASAAAREHGQPFTEEEIRLIKKRQPDLAAITSEKWLPVHSLVASGQFYYMDLLFQSNVNVNAVDKCGWTALHRAVMARRYAVYNYLLKKSANPFVLDNEGASLMHYAVLSGSLQAINTLLLYDLDINLQDSYGWTPLHLAVHARKFNAVRLLLTKGADRSLRNKDGLTALELCLRSGKHLETYYLIWLLKVFPGSRMIRGSSSQRIVNT